MSALFTHPFMLPDDVVFHLLRICSVVALTGLRSLDRLAATYVADELQRRYLNLLRPFVSDHKRFQDMLDEFGAVISGSGALAVCLHGSFAPNDLDVYVPKNAMTSVLSYFINAESYRLSHFLDPSTSENYQGGIDRVICLRRGSSSVDLVISHTNCATLPIPHFWSTASMVFLTGHSFCVPYPALLDDRRALLNPARITLPGAVAALSPVIQKYRALGFDFYLNEVDWRRTTTPAWECPRDRSPTCPITVRWIGDCFCLEGGFFPNTVARIPSWRRPMDLLNVGGTAEELTTVWWRGGVACGEMCRTGERGLVSGVWTQRLEHLE